jgi:hypothetical protein
MDGASSERVRIPAALICHRSILSGLEAGAEAHRGTAAIRGEASRATVQ